MGANIEPFIRNFVILTILPIIFSSGLIPSRNVNANPAIIRVVVGGSMDSQCGGGWDIHSPDAKWQPCDLQYALTTRADTSGGLGWEIWVKSGTYYPSTDKTNRLASFHLKDDVLILGGFAGTETVSTARNWQENQTILSGDIDKDGSAVNNSIHIVTGSRTGSSAILDGFTIQGGNAEADYGGGIYNDQGSPTLRNLILEGNNAEFGGAIANRYNSNPTINNVVIKSSNRYGMYNYQSRPNLSYVTFDNNFGGMVNESESDAKLFQVIFTENGMDGMGGMANYDSDPELTYVTFSHNSSTTFGGGMANTHSSPTLRYVTFNANSADCGGGMANYIEGNPKLVNVTFDHNSARIGGALCDEGGRSTGKTSITNATFVENFAFENASAIYVYDSNIAISQSTLTMNIVVRNDGNVITAANFSSVKIRNSIIWGNNTDLIFKDNSSYLSINYSDIKDNIPGVGNINTNPLLGKLGNFGGSIQTIPLLPGSPAINQIPISQCVDFDNVPIVDDERGVSRPQGVLCDMGAYEFEFPYSYFLSVINK